MESPIFQKVALKRISSLEQLDQTVRVTNPQGWIALIAFGAFLMAAVVWGFIGCVPVLVSGTGILLRKGGIHSVFSNSSGMVLDVKVSAKDRLASGQVVVTIAQPDVVKNVEDARSIVLQNQRLYDDALDDYNEGLRLGMKDLKRQEDYQVKSIEIAKAKLQNLQEKTANMKELLSKGLINKDLLDSAEDDEQAARQTLSRCEDNLKQLKTQEFDLMNQKSSALDQAKGQLTDAKNKLSTLELQLKDSTQIATPYDGFVTSVLVEKGNIVGPGTAVIQLELPQKRISAVLYVSPMDGKRVQPGMSVQLSPANVKQEEYGYMVARVVVVSQFPAPRQQMQALLENDDLVQQFCTAGNPYQVEVELEHDPATASGFRWSSRRDPPFQISSGTLCTGNIVTSEQAPISLMFPHLKGRTGL